MRSVLAGAVLCLAAACSAPRAPRPPRPFGDGVAFHTQFLGGYRALDHESSDGHPLVGLELVTRDPEHGWGYELGGTYGSDEEQSGATVDELEFDEVYFGLRRTFHPEEGATRTYLGLGGAVTRVEHTLRSPTREFDDHGGGAYVRGGVLWNMGRYPFDRGTEILVGLDLRAQAGDDVDYVELALVLGFGR